MRNVLFTSDAWEDYLYWQSQDKKTLKRINELIKAAQRTPFEGIGKPEGLRENLSGFWSRRIDEKNRLVYAVSDDEISIISCRYHY
ncbi:MAG: Txe/YoeB family addiction module toxin [Noviherbaspirillum sp.]|jgi:toxin YoeB|nr:Txe/YoeB family addiction module toxin [Noviherbaspirillum sp.]